MLRTSITRRSRSASQASITAYKLESSSSSRCHRAKNARMVLTFAIIVRLGRSSSQVITAPPPASCILMISFFSLLSRFLLKLHFRLTSSRPERGEEGRKETEAILSSLHSLPSSLFPFSFSIFQTMEDREMVVNGLT